MKYYIYGLYKKNCEYNTNSISENLFYIGITSGVKNLYHRQKNHKREKSNPHKLNIIAKYDFYLKVLWEVNTKKEAEQREEFLIRWFKRYEDGGILTNYLKSSNDLSRLQKPMSAETKSKISKALKKINSNKDSRLKNRDRNLSIPYDTIINLLDEWAKNPLESQQAFADRKKIKRSKFKDWMRLYKPEYIGLTKKIKQSIAQEIFDYSKTNRLVDAITIVQSKYNFLPWNKIKSIYYIYLSRLNKAGDNNE